MNKATVGTSDTNIWINIKDDIELKILDGTYAAGDKLPSIRKIANDYNVGKTTAQRVINCLCQEGIVEARVGVGFFVKPYIREVIVSKRKAALEKKILEVFTEATLINYDLRAMLDKHFSS